MKTNRFLLSVLTILAMIAVACGGTQVEEDGGQASPGGATEAISPDGGADPAAAPGFDPEAGTIRVLALLPLTGPAAGPAIVSGMNAYFEALNQEGGVAGKYQVESVVEDTQFLQDVTLSAYNQHKDNVTMLAVLLGTPHVSTVLPHLKQDDIVAVPISNAANWVKEANLVPPQGTFEVSVINVVSYVADDLGMADATWCTMTQEDPLGESFAGGFSVAQEEFGLNVAEAVTHPTVAEDVTAQVSNLQQAGCEVVSYHGSTGPTLHAATTAAQLNFTPVWIVPAQGYLKSYSESAVADYIAENWLVHGYDTPWADESVPGQAQLLEDMAEHEPDQEPEIIAKWGYQNAMATHQVLEKAVELGDLSREGILAAVEAIETLEFDGLLPDYPYGETVDDRRPPTVSHVLGVEPGVPTGLTAEQLNVDTELAKSYVEETFGSG